MADKRAMADLYIPKRIKVGYQDRSDTYTKRLAYVICYDTKGKLRKEGSWEGWRDKKIPAQEFDNLPHPGFILNKGHTRYNWSHFGSSRRTVVRVYDDRGIEFEISPENLVGLLMETTCAKRVIEGECVYAWAGKDLVLLPVGSEEYKAAMDNTKRQEMKVPSKELKPGCSYTTKKNEEVIYIGRYDWFEWDKHGKSQRICKKSHIFAHPKKPTDYNGKELIRFFPKDGASFLASLNNPDPVDNYAELVEEFSETFESSSVVGWESKPIKEVKVELASSKDDYYGPRLKREFYAKDEGDRIDFYHAVAVHERGYAQGSNKYTHTLKGYRFLKQGSIHKKNNHKAKESDYSYYNSYGFYDNWSHRHYGTREVFLTEDQLLAKLVGMSDIYMVLASGKKLKVKSLSDYGN